MDLCKILYFPPTKFYVCLEYKKWSHYKEAVIKKWKVDVSSVWAKKKQKKTETQPKKGWISEIGQSAQFLKEVLIRKYPIYGTSLYL